MNPRLLELATRHGALKVRIAEQRRQLALHTEPLAAVLDKGDALREGVDWLKQHPAAVGAAVAAVAIVRPKRAWRWARQGFFLWRGWQAVKSRLAGGQ